MTPIVELVAPRLLPVALMVSAALMTKGYTDVGEGFGAGVIVGLVLAMGLTQILRTLLFGVSPWDVGVFAMVATLLAAVSMGASYLPASRAARLEASSALRH